MIAPRDDVRVGEHAPATILLVEDERLIRVALTVELERSGYQVLAAATAERALELGTAQLESLAVVLTDLRLPGLSGLELLERLRARGLRCPVVVMSSYLDQYASQLARALPDVTLLAKPFDVEELGARLRRLLGGAEAAGPSP